jgi:hypothetical protein
MTQYVGIDPSSLCSLLPRAISLSGVFRDILTRHFLTANKIENPMLRDVIWKNAPDTGILIESVHNWQPATTERRPAVIIKRNAYQNMRRGLGDRRMGPHADREGFEHFVTYWTGSHTLFCLGGSGAQADILSAEVQRHLTQFTDPISVSLQLLRFQVLQGGPVAEVEEAQENFVVPITVGYTYEERCVIRPQVPLLTNISTSMILEC